MAATTAGSPPAATLSAPSATGPAHASNGYAVAHDAWFRHHHHQQLQPQPLLRHTPHHTLECIDHSHNDADAAISDYGVMPHRRPSLPVAPLHSLPTIHSVPVTAPAFLSLPHQHHLLSPTTKPCGISPLMFAATAAASSANAAAKLPAAARPWVFPPMPFPPPSASAATAEATTDPQKRPPSHRMASVTSLSPSQPPSTSNSNTPSPISSPTPSSSFFGIYSDSGFDMLSILALVRNRPEPIIDLGPVDMGSSFIVVAAQLEDMPIVYASRNFEALTGYTSAEVVGRNCRFLQAPHGIVDRGARREFVDNNIVFQLKRSIDKGVECQYININYKKGGEPFVNLITVIPVSADTSGSITHFVGFQVDLMQQSQAILRKLDDSSYVIDLHHEDSPRSVSLLNSGSSSMTASAIVSSKFKEWSSSSRHRTATSSTASHQSPVRTDASSLNPHHSYSQICTTAALSIQSGNHFIHSISSNSHNSITDIGTNTNIGFTRDFNSNCTSTIKNMDTFLDSRSSESDLSSAYSPSFASLSSGTSSSPASRSTSAASVVDPLTALPPMPRYRPDANVAAAYTAAATAISSAAQFASQLLSDRLLALSTESLPRPQSTVDDQSPQDNDLIKLDDVPGRLDRRRTSFQYDGGLNQPADPTCLRRMSADGGAASLNSTSTAMPKTLATTFPASIAQKRHMTSQLHVARTAKSASVSSIKATISDHRKLVHASNDFIHILSSRGIILFASESASTSSLGYTPKQLVGRNISRFCHPGDVITLMRELKSTPLGQPISTMLRLRASNGAYIWLEVVGHKYELANQKKTKCFILSGRERRLGCLSHIFFTYCLNPGTLLLRLCNRGFILRDFSMRVETDDCGGSGGNSVDCLSRGVSGNVTHDRVGTNIYNYVSRSEHPRLIEAFSLQPPDGTTAPTDQNLSEYASRRGPFRTRIPCTIFSVTNEPEMVDVIVERSSPHEFFAAITRAECAEEMPALPLHLVDWQSASSTSVSCVASMSMPSDDGLVRSMTLSSSSSSLSVTSSSLVASGTPVSGPSVGMIGPPDASSLQFELNRIKMSNKRIQDEIDYLTMSGE